MVEQGASARIVFVADDFTTAIALGSGDLRVLGTPKIVALCEEAAVSAISGSLDESVTTVGTHISVDHLAPTAVGQSVTVSAVVIGIDGRKLQFEVLAREGEVVVARGAHTRVIVDRARFLGGLDAR